MSAVAILRAAGVKPETAAELVDLVRAGQFMQAWELVQVSYPDKLRRGQIIAKVTKIYHQAKNNPKWLPEDTEFLVEKCLAYAK